VSRNPKVVRTVAELRDEVGRWRAAGQSVALVPTMGALHAGHLALVHLAQERCRRTVVSIFVNPAQFAPSEDFSTYPRTFEGDLAQLATLGVHLVWAPEAAEMYPPGFATRIVPAGAAQDLETRFRPHFFSGVTTVCCKLFCQVLPDIAVFGEKDYQQLAVIRQMVRDLNLPLEIAGAPTVREADGLAMSSRNAYLSTDERAIAPRLYTGVCDVAAAVRAGIAAEEACAMARDRLLAAGFRSVDYIDVRTADSLQAPAPGDTRPLRVLAAAWLGRTRLIDNVPVA
jgi:pantoate--beta-alanine ligase